MPKTQTALIANSIPVDSSTIVARTSLGRIITIALTIQELIRLMATSILIIEAGSTRVAKWTVVIFSSTLMPTD